MKARALVCMFAILLCTGYLHSGVERYYTFEYDTQTYSAISGTILTFAYAGVDDDISGAMDIGFPFPYCGAVHTQLKVSTNGFLNPGATWPYHSSNNQLQYGIYPVIAPLWDNLSTMSGNVQYLLAGEAPNRTYTVQFYHVRWPNNSSTAWVSFQVVLHEDGTIEFIYGPNAGNPAPGSASIGMNMPNAGDGNYLSITPGSPPTVSTTQENYSINAHIPTGTVYRFVPKPPVQVDLSLTRLMPSQPNGMFYDQGVPFLLPATVVNNATVTTGDYDVVLYCDGEEITRVSGVPLAPGEVYVYDLPALVLVSGYHCLRAEVLVPDDEYPGDNAREYRCIVRPDPSTAHIFGLGDQNVRIPIDLYWRYSLYQAMYYPADVGSTGWINGISFFNEFVVANVGAPMRVWVGETNAADLSAGWVPAAEMELVWDSEMVCPSGQNEIYIPFGSPYRYQGGNLLIMAYQSNNYYNGGQCYFHSQTLDGLRAINRYTDMYDPDPYNPTTYNVMNGVLPQTAFYITAASDVQDELIDSPITIQNHPNPFTHSTSFRLNPEVKTPLKVRIYNLKGQKLRELVGVEPQWDACDENGIKVPAGIYLAITEYNGRVCSRKLCKY